MTDCTLDQGQGAFDYQPGGCVLLAVFLLCGFSLTAQAACPVFGPSEDPCSGPVFGPSTCECP
ncbi:hypothetical protein CDC12_15630 [Pseudomonas aeruginosa]|nr:hypothetical protein CDC12_15630 [Pseudomonas aeruginosa]